MFGKNYGIRNETGWRAYFKSDHKFEEKFPSNYVIKKNTRLWDHYDLSLEPNELECFEKCLKDPKCFGSTYDYSLIYPHANCYLYDKNYLLSYDESWISFLKVDDKKKITLYSKHNFGGSSNQIMPIDGICRELPKDFWDETSSIRRSYNCIVLFSNENCTSDKEPIRFPNFQSYINESNFGGSWFNDKARSYTSCQGYKIINNGQVLETNETRSVLWNSYYGAINQVWEFEPLPFGFLKLRNRAYGLYLKANPNLVTDNYSLQRNQEWSIDFNSKKIINRENKISFSFEKIEILNSGNYLFEHGCDKAQCWTWCDNGNGWCYKTGIV